MSGVRHDPMLAATGRFGCWCNCTCGWKSRTYKRVFGAHLAFGRHLLAARAGAGAAPGEPEGTP